VSFYPTAEGLLHSREAGVGFQVEVPEELESVERVFWDRSLLAAEIPAFGAEVMVDLVEIDDIVEASEDADNRSSVCLCPRSVVRLGDIKNSGA
jgi:hypothetical protein